MARRRPQGDAGASEHRTAGFEGPGNASERTPESLAYHAGFARLIASISRDFLGMAPDQIDRGIQAALRAVGEYAGVDRAFLFQLSDDRSLLFMAHEWCAAGIEPQIENLQELPTKAFPWARAQIARAEIVRVPRVASRDEVRRTRRARGAGPG